MVVSDVVGVVAHRNRERQTASQLGVVVADLGPQLRDPFDRIVELSLCGVRCVV